MKRRFLHELDDPFTFIKGTDKGKICTFSLLRFCDSAETPKILLLLQFAQLRLAREEQN